MWVSPGYLPGNHITAICNQITRYSQYVARGRFKTSEELHDYRELSLLIDELESGQDWPLTWQPGG